jgi:Holliday junction DNA helicase RuvA
MISRISGIVVARAQKFLVIDTGGVGYKLFVTSDTLARASLDAPLSLWTHLVVREDALDLYGFSTESEVSFFEMLIGISGVGPRTALGIMGVASVNTLRSAIASGDTAYLTKVSGIGKKSAEKITLELRDKLGAYQSEVDGAGFREDSEALDALIALGYSAKEARDALKEIPTGTKGTNDRIKEALRILSGAQ